MAETFYLRGRAANGPTVYYPHAYKSVDDALHEAEKTSAAGNIVWIVDGAENPVLPADQVRIRLQHRKNGSLRRA